MISSSWSVGMSVEGCFNYISCCEKIQCPVSRGGTQASCIPWGSPGVLCPVGEPRSPVSQKAQLPGGLGIREQVSVHSRRAGHLKVLTPLPPLHSPAILRPSHDSEKQLLSGPMSTCHTTAPLRKSHITQTWLMTGCIWRQGFQRHCIKCVLLCTNGLFFRAFSARLPILSFLQQRSPKVLSCHSS